MFRLPIEEDDHVDEIGSDENGSEEDGQKRMGQKRVFKNVYRIVLVVDEIK